MTFSHNVHILAHDASTKMVLGYTKIGQVIIGNNVFIGAGSIVLPGITIGNNVIIGAGSVVTHDIPDGCVFAGNPARKISSLEDYAKKSRKLFADSPQYNESYTIRGKIDKSKKMQMNNELIGKAGYVK